MNETIAANAESKVESVEDIYQRVFGKTEDLPTELTAELRLLTQSLGEVSVKTDGQHITHLPSAALQARLNDYLKTSTYQSLSSSLNQTAWIATAQLEKAGITVAYNRQDLTIDVSISPSSLNRRMRSVLSALAGQGSIIPEGLAEPAKISGYLNFFSDFSYDKTRQPSLRSQIRFDNAVNVNGFVLEQQFTYRPESEARFVRDRSRLIVDDVENERRYQLGDIQTQGRNQQSYLSLGGFQVLGDMNWPSAQTYRPYGNYTFTLDSAADVSVYQDGHLTNTLHLNAGEHTLAEVQALQGTDIELRIKNDFGQRSTQRFSRFTDGRLLNPDQSRYALSVGFPSSYNNDGPSYDTKHRIVSGYYQRGLTETLTAGMDAQTDGTRYQLGMDAIWATRLGNVTASLAETKNTARQTGKAARLQINKPTQAFSADQQRTPDWGLSFERYQPTFQAFSAADQPAELQPVKWQASAQVSHALSDTLSTSASASKTRFFEKNASDTLSLNLNKQWGKRINLSLSAQRQHAPDQVADHAFRISLGVALDATASGRAQSLQASYGDTDDAQLAYYLGSNGAYGRDSLTSAVRLDSTPDSQALHTDFRWQQPTWDGSASLQQTRTHHDQSTTAHLNLNGALVFADGVIAQSKTVSDSFAILEAPAGLERPMAVSQGKSLFARKDNNLDGLPERYDALIPPEGKTTLATLSAYNVQHISTDSLVLPENLNLDATEFDVLPDYKSGYRLKVGGERGVDLQVSVLDSHGQPVALQAARLIAANHAKSILMIFTDADGVMRVPNLARGRYRLEWLNRPASQPVWIDINAAAGQTQTLELRTP